jgi:hypothetical protein
VYSISNLQIEYSLISRGIEAGPYETWRTHMLSAAEFRRFNERLSQAGFESDETEKRPRERQFGFIDSNEVMIKGASHGTHN